MPARILAASDRVTSDPLDSAYKFSLLDSLGIKVFQLEELLVIESGKTRTRTAHEPVERIVGVGKHFVGTTLAKSTEEACYCACGLYGYSVVGDKRNHIILTPQQAQG